jgi:hypothetical protein
MFGKTASMGAMLALALAVGFAAAKPSRTASCCVTKTRCCTTAQVCCNQPETAACCKTGTACCDRKDCCGPQRKAPASACPVTGLERAQCCASKASQTPPCCQQGCDTAGRLVR